MNLNDQETVTGEITKTIAKCFQLRIIDLSGVKGIDEAGLGNIVKGSIEPKEFGEKATLVGLQYLTSLKLNTLDKIFDSSIVNILRACPNMQQLELNKCENVSEFLFEAITNQKVAPNLKYLDNNKIKNIKADPLEEFR